LVQLFVDGSPLNEDQLGHRSATLFYLEPESTHTFRVDARDASGNVAQSHTLTVTTVRTDTTPPTAPTTLHTTFQSREEAWIEWDPATNDTDPQELILYEVYLNGVLVDDGGVGGTNRIAYGRDPGPTEIVLRAVDTSGNRSGPSNALVFGC
jgi:hypothetical protein